MRNYSPRPRSPWLDVAAVVFVLAIVLVPLVYLVSEVSIPHEYAPETRRGSTGGSSYGPSGGGSSFSTWKARQGREAGTPLGGGPFGGGAVAGGGGSAAPFSSSWRAQATPSLSGDLAAPEGRGAVAVGGASSRQAPRGGFRGGRSSTPSFGSYAAPSRRSSGSEAGANWAGEAERFAGQALALSRQLGQMAQDPVDRSLGEQAAPSASSSGPQTASKSGATTNDNPGTPDQPTLPIDDHLHWLLAAGLLWGVWRLGRG